MGTPRIPISESSGNQGNRSRLFTVIYATTEYITSTVHFRIAAKYARIQMVMSGGQGRD